MPQLPPTGSVPFFAHKQPQQVLEEGVRLDGRGFEEFRAVCERQAIISHAFETIFASRFLCDHSAAVQS